MTDSPIVASPINNKIVDITASNAQQYVIDASYQQPVLVDFWTEGCAPCKVLTPILERIVTESRYALCLAKVNVEKLPSLAEQFGVQSVPTVVIMVEGVPVNAFQGIHSEEDIITLLTAELAAD